MSEMMKIWIGLNRFSLIKIKQTKFYLKRLTSILTVDKFEIQYKIAQLSG